MRQIGSLAHATRTLPEAWPADDADATVGLVQEWLQLPSERWRSLAWQDIEDCHPPIHELTVRKHGLRLVRWLAHRILPYPCFLWTEARLAARFKVTGDSLRVAMSYGLADFLKPARYSGALHDFFGTAYWWHRGVESILWDVTGGGSFDAVTTLGVLNQRCANKLQALDAAHTVVCVDGNFRFRDEPCDVNEAVRVQPDDWPVYAEQAWATLQEVREQARLRSAVLAADRFRLGGLDTAEGE